MDGSPFLGRTKGEPALSPFPLWLLCSALPQVPSQWSPLLSPLWLGSPLYPHAALSGSPVAATRLSPTVSVHVVPRDLLAAGDRRSPPPPGTQDAPRSRVPGCCLPGCSVVRPGLGPQAGLSSLAIPAPSPGDRPPDVDPPRPRSPLAAPAPFSLKGRLGSLTRLQVSPQMLRSSSVRDRGGQVHLCPRGESRESPLTSDFLSHLVSLFPIPWPLFSRYAPM